MPATISLYEMTGAAGTTARPGGAGGAGSRLEQIRTGRQPARGRLARRARRASRRAALARGRVEREELALGRLRERVGDLLLERRVERDRAQRRVLVEVGATVIVRASACRAYSASSGGSRVSEARSPIASRIVPRSRIETPSREQLLQDALHLADAELVGDDLLDGGRVLLLERVEQLAASPGA